MGSPLAQLQMGLDASLVGVPGVAVLMGDARYRWTHKIPGRLLETTGLRRRW